MASDTVASVAYARLASTMSTTWGQVGQRTKWGRGEGMGGEGKGMGGECEWMRGGGEGMGGEGEGMGGEGEGMGEELLVEPPARRAE